ncbi:MAG: DNA methyltransferase [Actinomycetota bacterium]
MEPNTLYYGDNLDILRRHVRDESIDLVYLDPPFSSNANYNILFEEHGEKAAAQVQAFSDTWEWNTEARATYEEIVEAGGKTAETMRAFRTMLGGSDMLAYLSMMAPRLIELHRVLKSSGSLYLHCDPTASHYLKLLLDAVFGPKNFRNEIIWWYRKWSRGEHQFLRNHDVLLFYSKSADNKFNVLRVPLAPSTLRRFGGKRQDYADEAKTRKVTTDEESAGGFRPDVWPISLLPAQANERLGYPTQKPLALLRLVIEASSSPGDLILDPFAGCGTTIDAAQEMTRRWIGIDITHYPSASSSIASWAATDQQSPRHTGRSANRPRSTTRACSPRKIRSSSRRGRSDSSAHESPAATRRAATRGSMVASTSTKAIARRARSC